jgi:hypothetical protein
MRESTGDGGREAPLWIQDADGVAEVTFLLPGQALAALEQMAAQRQLTTGSLLRTLIASFLDREIRSMARPPQGGG